MYQPHLRLSMTGTIPDGEIFSIGVALVPDNAPWAGLATDIARMEYLDAFMEAPADAFFPDLVTDCSSYFGAAETEIFQSVVLKRVKLASIGTEGTYLGTPREAAVNVPGGRSDFGAQLMPHQIARKVTLETDADLGRVKGGFYLPGVSTYEFDPVTNLHSAASAARVRDRTKQFLDGLNNVPGVDTYSFRVVIASQGRHNKNGTLRLPPGNHPVERVNVGRRVDVQRRRANKHSEARITDAALA